MKIFIAGSMSFAKQFVEAKEYLEARGYATSYASDTEECIEKPDLNMDAEHAFERDIMRECFERQEQCDAIMVLNYTRNGVEGYIGGHTLIELGFAYYLKQKIFLLYPPPPVEECRYSHEILHMKPIILNGDLSQLEQLKNNS